ncbi:hypothetical protein [Pedobacter sp. WC2423]|uniref:hypothetical protein n=1 Tax=Pedobacter sp. WC2423 TaxID=3234142 RepID=UPI00346581F9
MQDNSQNTLKWNSTFTYLRKDLLDKYLIANGLTMFQIFLRERDYYPIDGNGETDRKRTRQRRWASFYHSIEYQTPKTS